MIMPADRKVSPLGEDAQPAEPTRQVKVLRVLDSMLFTIVNTAIIISSLVVQGETAAACFLGYFVLEVIVRMWAMSR
jgi:hypothetical protein